MPDPSPTPHYEIPALCATDVAYAAVFRELDRAILDLTPAQSLDLYARFAVLFASPGSPLSPELIPCTYSRAVVERSGRSLRCEAVVDADASEAVEVQGAVDAFLARFSGPKDAGRG